MENKLKAWAFGGGKKPFTQSIVEGLDTVFFGRDNTDYTNPDKFILDNKETPLPDIVVFNLNCHVNDPEVEKSYTLQEDFETIQNGTMPVIYFNLRIIQWLFSKGTNIKIVYLTSMAPYIMDEETDMVLYKITRSIEHAIIRQNNILKKNIDKQNYIMGLCVGVKSSGVENFINRLITENQLEPGIYGISEFKPPHPSEPDWILFEGDLKYTPVRYF